MQQPTYTGLHIRTTRDADIIFHAVAQGLLPMVSRRLDSEERMALCSGCIYVWEERTSNISESPEQGIERFTEGRSWGPSRARDDFLYYHEKDNAPKSLMVERTRAIRYSEDPSGASWMYPRRKGERMIKQTYSVYVTNTPTLRKWHLNAYWTQETLNQLSTVDDIPEFRSIMVPIGRYVCARTSRMRESMVHVARGTPSDEDSPTARSHTGAPPEYNAFRGHHHRDCREGMPSYFPPAPRHDPNGIRLAPLEELEGIRHLRRDPIAEVALRALNTAHY